MSTLIVLIADPADTLESIQPLYQAGTFSNAVESSHFLIRLEPPAGCDDWGGVGAVDGVGGVDGFCKEELCDYVEYVGMPTVISHACETLGLRPENVSIVAGCAGNVVGRDLLQRVGSSVNVATASHEEVDVGVTGKFCVQDGLEDSLGEMKIDCEEEIPLKIISLDGRSVEDAIAEAFGLEAPPRQPPARTQESQARGRTSPLIAYSLSEPDPKSSKITCTYKVTPSFLAVALSAHDVACCGCFFSFRVVSSEEGTFATDFVSGRPSNTANEILKRLIARLDDPEGFDANQCCLQ